jgi:hypothetical protein
MAQYDVVVIGGGTAGTVAAIQSGRAGARTLLVEKNGMLGGTMTVGGVNFPALFFAWGRQVIAGIGWELVTATLAETGGELPDFSDVQAPHWRHHVLIDRAIFAALADQAVLDAGVEMLLHAMVGGVAWNGEGWDVTVCTKGGLRPVRCRVLIDCTGDANAVSLAGLPVDQPDECQPGTVAFRIGGYDADALDMERISDAYMAAVREGILSESDLWQGLDGAPGFLRGHGRNSNHVVGVRAATSEERTHAEIEGRRVALRLYRFFRAQPGLEGLRIEDLSPEVGIREGGVIRGKKTITHDDYWGGRVWDDAVCYSFYPIDLHLPVGVDTRRLPEGIVPTIPRDAMLPEGGRSLIAAGRCISGDRLAHSAYRVEATCMATGQAAGAMASLAAERGVDPEELPIGDVHHMLRRHSAIVPDLREA